MKKIWKSLVCVMLALCLLGQGAALAEDAATATDASDGYALDKVVIFSRHNMRAPTKSSSKVLNRLTPYTWVDYTAPYGELTLLGGLQETAMGQYFRKYLAEKGLMEEDWIPEEGRVRFYANSYQRTISTASYFAAGLLPVANVDIEWHADFGTMDPVFKPCVNFISDAWLEQVQSEMDALADGRGLQGVLEQNADAIALLEDVIDFKDSDYAKENGLTSLLDEETTVTYELGEEPTAAGGMKNASSAADALIMQYYADPDLTDAAFGRELTWEQWCAIGSIYSMYTDVLFSLPSVAVNVANPLLKEIRSEMAADDRVISFLCGHDSNLVPLLVALGAEDYPVEGNLCEDTPIGIKLVIEKYTGADGEAYASVYLAYQDSESLRANELVTLDNPPIRVDLSFSGLTKNADGYFLWQDVLDLFNEAIAAFDDLPQDESNAA